MSSPKDCACGGLVGLIHRPDCSVGSKEFWEKMGSSQLKNPGHKVCLNCTGIKECPQDCERGDQHEWCDCMQTIKQEMDAAIAAEEIDPPTSPRDFLYALHMTLCDDALQLMQKKNHDYASEEDPYRNFRHFGLLGILVRLSDKLARLQSFEENGRLDVEDESIRDTVLDAINYLILFEGLRLEE